MQPTNLFESLFIFHKCATTLQELRQELQIIDRSKSNFNKKHITITNYVIMESVSYLDEFEQNFYFRCEAEFKDKVILVRKLSEPIFIRIKQWSDIKDFRNHVIAHPWRDKNKKFVIPDLNKYKIPRNPFEYVVMINLFEYVHNIIISVFKVEVELMLKYMETLVPTEKEKTNYDQLTEDHISMAEEVNAIANETGYNYQMQVIGYAFD